MSFSSPLLIKLIVVMKLGGAELCLGRQYFVQSGSLFRALRFARLAHRDLWSTLPHSSFQQLWNDMYNKGDYDVPCPKQFGTWLFCKDKLRGTYKPVWLYNSSEFGLDNVTTCEVFDFGGTFSLPLLIGLFLTMTLCI